MPKKVPLDLVVPGTPEEVAKALKEDTLFRPFPTTGSGPIRRSKKTYGGRVSDAGFNVSLYEPTWLNLTNPVARAKLSESPSGTRIEGEVGLHPLVIFWLRLATVVMFAAAGVAGFGALTAGAAAPGIVGLLFFLLLIIPSIGINVAHADENAEKLHAAIEATLRSGALAARRPLLDADPDALRAAEAELDALSPKVPDRTPEGPAGS